MSQGGLTIDRGRLMGRLRAALDKSAEEIAASARDGAERLFGPGPLSQSISAETAQADESGRLTVRVRADAPHAVFVELGTLHMPARPFLAPALDEARPAVVARLALAVRAALKARR